MSAVYVRVKLPLDKCCSYGVSDNQMKNKPCPIAWDLSQNEISYPGLRKDCYLTVVPLSWAVHYDGFHWTNLLTLGYEHQNKGKIFKWNSEILLVLRSRLKPFVLRGVQS